MVDPARSLAVGQRSTGMPNAVEGSWVDGQSWSTSWFYSQPFSSHDQPHDQAPPTRSLCLALHCHQVCLRPHSGGFHGAGALRRTESRRPTCSSEITQQNDKWVSGWVLLMMVYLCFTGWWFQIILLSTIPEDDYSCALKPASARGIDAISSSELKQLPAVRQYLWHLKKSKACSFGCSAFPLFQHL